MLPLIVGTGLQTPLGTSVESTWRALLQGRFITDPARVPMEAEAGVARITAIATAAALECISSANTDARAIQSTDTALVVGTSKGPIEQWLKPARSASGLGAFYRACSHGSGRSG